MAAALLFASFASPAQTSLVTAIIRPSAGGKLAIQIVDSLPSGAAFKGFTVHAYGVKGLTLVSAGEAAYAGTLIPGVPNKVRVLDTESGSVVEVVSKGPVVVVRGAIVFPDNYAVMNCGDYYFAAGMVGESTNKIYFGGDGATVYYRKFNIAGSGRVEPYVGNMAYSRVRGLTIEMEETAQPYSYSAPPRFSHSILCDEIPAFVGY